MLNNSRILAMVPVMDLERAKTFYTQKLGLKVFMEPMPGIVTLQTEGESQLVLYQRGPSKADHTLVTFLVEDVEKEVNELKEKGVLFESYNTGEIKTDENNVSTYDNHKAAWFKDSEGNILGLTS